MILDGGSRSEAAKVAGVTLQIVRDWVLRFNAGGPDGLAAHDVVRWRLCDLAQWIWDEFALSVTRHTLGRELRAMGYRKLSARPGHRRQKGDDIANF